LSEDQSQESERERVIGATGGFAVVAGSMLGIGIFLSPPIVAGQVDSTILFYFLWFFGGVIALAGAVACAELGAMMPRSGGDYVFQYEAFGPSVAFASGWVLFAAVFAGSIATMSVGLCTYQIPVLFGVDLSTNVLVLPWGHPITGSECAALTLVVALTVINTLGASVSTRMQTVLTAVPIAALALMSLYAIVVGGAPALGNESAETSETLSLSKLVVSYMAVYFAYSGWINIIYVAGEVKQPGRNIPRSLIGGTVAVTILYLFLCFGFNRVLGLAGLSEAGEAGSATAALLGGEVGRIAITLLIALALAASINGTVLGGARVAFAMAGKGAIWSRLGTLGGRNRVPIAALWLQMAISVGLILTGTFEDLYFMVSMAMSVTGTLTVASVFVLRRRAPEWPRPYRATGYPWLPGLYIVSSIFALGVMGKEAIYGDADAWYSLIGLIVLVVAYGLHRIALTAGISAESKSD
jgi:APA family basic amino acid/polyamine antiporter